jgi:hypothetical protein
MPSTFKLSTLLQNSYAASAVRAPIRHSVPEINVSLADQWSVAAEFTAATGNTMATSFQWQGQPMVPLRWLALGLAGSHFHPSMSEWVAC